jgi:hypothetical protein
MIALHRERRPPQMTMATFAGGLAMEVHERPTRKCVGLLTQDCYSPEELATMLEMDVNLIRQATYNSRLQTCNVEHHVLNISRADALHWLDERD